MSYPTEAEQEAFTAGWNAAMAFVEKDQAEYLKSLMQVSEAEAEHAISKWMHGDKD